MLKEFIKLTPVELKSFKDFLNSPYYNKSNTNLKIFSYLSSLYPDINNRDVSVKAIRDFLSQEGSISDAYARKIISNFKNVFLSFLINEEVKKDKMGNIIKLLKALRIRGLDKQFLNIHKIARKKNNLEIRDEYYYFNEIKSAEESRNIDYPGTISKNYLIYQDIEDNIDLQFIMQKLHYFNVMNGMENFHMKKIYKKTFYKEILKFVEANKFSISESHPYLYLEFLALKMDQSYNEKDETNFINYFKSLTPDKNHEDYIRLYLFKLEYHYKFGYSKLLDPSHYSKLLALYKWSYSNKYFQYFLTNGILYETIYISIITLALNEKDFEWTEQFIRETKNSLHPRKSSKMYNLAKAKLFFSLKKYQDCFIYLNKIKLNDSLYYFEVKMTIAKIFFEKEDYDSAESTITAMSKYYYKNKNIHPDLKHNFRMNLKFFRKLLKHVNDLKKENDLPFLKNELIETNALNFSVKFWYLDAIDRLLKK